MNESGDEAFLGIGHDLDVTRLTARKSWL